MAARPCIALLTDFGHTDAYVGIMKGVMAGICRDATFIDLGHDVAPQDVRGGAMQLLGAYRFFPPGTVFLCVVDPHVGTARRSLAMEAGPYRFVGPDNGLMAWAAAAAAGEGCVRAHAIENERYRLPEVSMTFHGRDLFAPAAAHLAAGVAIDDLGSAVQEWETLDWPEPDLHEGSLSGAIVHVDHFGNLITNISRAHVERLMAEHPQRGVHVRFRGAIIEEIVQSYGYAEPGAVVALYGSTGFLELAVNGGSAQKRFDARLKEHVTVLAT